MKKFKWSKNRPVKPDVDPMLDDLRQELLDDDRTYYQKANASGIAPSTIRNIVNQKTRKPQGLTIFMLYRALGIEFIKRRKK
ncbi:hypothetical protein [Rhizobium phage RHph_X2_28B]|uniref:hypothetical protein n=1 Tax=Rhizobium phage RHph_X2_28B TaxID=2836086 RepID=UPI002329735F|nr:hypothetical protein PP751_gp016 [Rhizobium phage RHph_X2_28B]QWY83468.1 hypothetical protein [Rhizobium phage RHph_X2_28B]QWY83704.1 hypothetical protein [Rhizobium phage RHph_X3_15]